MSEEVFSKKVYYFKGKTLEELQQLSNEEVLKYMGSRGRRSLKRGFTEAQKDLMKKVEESFNLLSAGKQQKRIKTHARDAIITPKMPGLKIDVYNGKTFEAVQIKQEMIGHYLGEFSFTRKRVVHASGGSGGKGSGSVSLK